MAIAAAVAAMAMPLPAAAQNAPDGKVLFEHANITWTPELLDDFLRAPATLIGKVT